MEIKYCLLILSCRMTTTFSNTAKVKIIHIRELQYKTYRCIHLSACCTSIKLIETRQFHLNHIYITFRCSNRDLAHFSKTNLIAFSYLRMHT